MATLTTIPVALAVAAALLTAGFAVWRARQFGRLVARWSGEYRGRVRALAVIRSVLLIATLQLDAANGALIMIAFGLGTAPALFIAACGAQRLSAFASRPVARHVGGSVLMLSAVLTLAGPWIEHSLPGLHAWLPFDCQAR